MNGIEIAIIIAILVLILTLGLGIFSMRHKASTSYVEMLEQRLIQLESEAIEKKIENRLNNSEKLKENVITLIDDVKTINITKTPYNKAIMDEKEIEKKKMEKVQDIIPPNPDLKSPGAYAHIDDTPQPKPKNDEELKKSNFAFDPKKPVEEKKKD